MKNFFLQWKKGNAAKMESTEVPKIECSLRMRWRKVDAGGWCSSVEPILLQRILNDGFLSVESSLSFCGFGLFGFFQRCVSFVSCEAFLF